MVQKVAARGDRGTDYPKSGPVGVDPPAAEAEQTDEAPEHPPDLLPATVEPNIQPTVEPTVAHAFPHAFPAVGSNPGPLPDPLPPRLDEVVRRLREDLLQSGGAAAGLADEICARHRDRLREALGLDG